MAHYESKRSFQNNYIYHQNDINLNFPLHIHRSFEVMVVLDGEIEISVESRKFNLKKNECIIVLPNEVHGYITKEYSKTQLCIFSIDQVEDFYNTINGYYASNPVFCVDNPVEIAAELKNPRNIYHFKSTLYQLISLFYQNAKLKKSIKSADFSHRILSYIEEHLDENITLTEISNEMGYTYNYISTLFKSSFGMDFPTLLNKCRINEACLMLSNDDLSIAKIAMSCGYNSLRSFNRNFYKIKQMTPTDFRKKC